jgi:SNF2 family DNA or RNA helicase
MSELNPFAHQVRALDIARTRDRYAFFFEPGCGKTITTLMICDAKGGRTCVVAPKSVARTAWTEDPRDYFPAMKVECVAGQSKAKRKAAIYSDCDLLVINPESFWRHRADIGIAGFDRLVIDESSKAKNPKAKFTQSVIDIADRVRDVYLLSGTPAPNGEHEYWPQMRSLDKGVFGDSYYRFLSRYFTPIQKRYGSEVHITGYDLKPSMRDDFTTRLAGWSWHLKKTECLDLPEQTDIIRRIELSPKEMTAYRDAKDGAITDADGKLESINTQAVGMKLQQICGGWVYAPGGGSVQYGKSKLNELQDILDEIGKEPVVIWATFRHDVDLIAGALDGCGIIDARTSGKADRIIDAFRAGEYRYLVCHPKAAGHGVTMVNASHAVYYSLPWSSEEYQQSRDRIHRAGQTKACTYWHIIAEKTVDERVYGVVKKKIKAADAVLQELQK